MVILCVDIWSRQTWVTSKQEFRFQFHVTFKLKTVYFVCMFYWIFTWNMNTFLWFLHKISILKKHKKKLFLFKSRKYLNIFSIKIRIEEKTKSNKIITFALRTKMQFFVWIFHSWGVEPNWQFSRFNVAKRQNIEIDRRWIGIDTWKVTSIKSIKFIFNFRTSDICKTCKIKVKFNTYSTKAIIRLS
jgi:hypothetical protein